jgi:NADPH:quinone reductase-like Zn-dependent oxidoreductase
MKAVIQETYGSADVLQLREVPKPTPQDNELLIKVHAASVNAYDWHLMRAEPFIVRFAMGFFKPKNPTLGADIAGVVEAVGKDITQFQPGDEVLGDLSSCGAGGFAEYVTAPQEALILKPASMTFAEAAAVPMAAVTALQGLRDVGKLQAGQKVLINGASGGVGTFAVQIAKLLGAEVTAVCSTAKIDQARALGADHVIDYTQEDFTQSGKQYDLILGVNGSRSLADYERALTPTGIYVMAGGSNSQIFSAVLLGSFKSKSGGQTMTSVSAKPNQTDLTFIRDAIVAGDISPVLDREYPLSQTADAIRYVENGHARGKVVINVATNGL